MLDLAPLPVGRFGSYDLPVPNTALDELLGELKQLVSGRPGVVDGVLSPVVFVSVNSFAGVGPAAVAGAAIALLIVGWRLVRGRAASYAVGGLVGTALAIALALRSGDARDYFLPGLVSGVVTTAAALGSIVVRRPLAAWASWVSRGWNLDWYWHPQVRPAYTTATWLWVGFFGARTAIQAWLYVTEQTTTLGAVRVVTGWPGLLALLVGTYLVGRGRLESLGGPSVEEFESGTPPPWEGQTTGF